jgi:hypothetical protein
MVMGMPVNEETGVREVRGRWKRGTKPELQEKE